MKKYISEFGFLSVFAFSVATVTSAHAAIVLDNTRVVYADADREASVKLTNTGSVPVVVQSWLDDGEVKKDPSLLKVPFILMPPMTRVDPGKGQTLRLIYTGDTLPKDRESVYYLNVLEIPPKAEDSQEKNYVQVALRTRVKVFYRGASIKGSAEDAPSKLVWSMAQVDSKWTLQCSNPTSYYVSLSEVSLVASEKSTRVGDGMVAPGAKLNITLDSQPPRGAQVKFLAIDDFGAARENLAPMLP